MASSDIGSKTKSGILYSTASKMAGSFGQTFSLIFLARLLAPEDFGLVAVGMLVIGFATKFGEFGFHNGLVQRKEDIDDRHINTLFLMDMVFKSVLWGAIYLATPAIASFMGTPELVNVLPWISSYMVLECLSATPMAVLRREMNFKLTAIVNTAEKFTRIIASIALAFAGFGVWSLIYGKILGIILAAVLALRFVSWTPRLQYDHTAFKELFHFGAMVFVRNLFRYGGDNTDIFYVSKFLGVQALGFYEKAYQLMRLPQKRITNGINKVVFSAFSRIQDEPERIRQAFRKLVLAITLASFPLMTGMAFVAPLFITVVLGQKWEPMVAPLQILCITGILLSVDPFLNSLLTATGYVRSTVTRRGFEFLLIAVAAWFGLKYGIVGVAAARVVVSIIIMFVMVRIITRMTSVGWLDYFGPMWPATATSAIMLGVMFGATAGLKQIMPSDGLLMLLAQVAVGMISYVLAHLAIRFQAVTALRQEVAGDTKKIWRKVRRKLGMERDRVKVGKAT